MLLCEFRGKCIDPQSPAITRSLARPPLLTISLPTKNMLFFVHRGESRTITRVGGGMSVARNRRCSKSQRMCWNDARRDDHVQSIHNTEANGDLSLNIIGIDARSICTSSGPPSRGHERQAERLSCTIVLLGRTRVGSHGRRVDRVTTLAYGSVRQMRLIAISQHEWLAGTGREEMRCSRVMQLAEEIQAVICTRARERIPQRYLCWFSTASLSNQTEYQPTHSHPF